MNNKIVIAFLIILSAAVSFLAVQNFKLRKQVDEISAVKEDTKNTPANTETRPANPEGASPFDKPNVDPLANGFPEKSKGLTSIRFERKVHDFGRINEGDVVSTTFKFTNTGELALLISDAKGSCGCTVPHWPQQPVKPGETAEIAVQFDSHDKRGEVEKTVTVSSNTNPATTLLVIKSTIVPKDK